MRKLKRRPYLNIQHFADPNPEPETDPIPNPNPNPNPEPEPKPVPVGLTAEEIQKLIAESVATAIAGIKSPEPTPKPAPKNDDKQPTSYKDDPEYMALINDLKYKRASEVDIKKKSMMADYGLEESDFQGMTTLSQLDGLENIVKKTKDKIVKDTLTEEVIAKHLKGKHDMIKSLSDTFSKAEITETKKKAEKIGGIMNFIRGK